MPDALIVVEIDVKITLALEHPGPLAFAPLDHLFRFFLRDFEFMG